MNKKNQKIMKEYKIVKFRKEHLDKILELYKFAYNRKQDKAYFKKRLLDNTFGKPIIFLMEYEKEIVGFYAIHPIKLLINQKNTLGGYSYLTMTHPEHQGNKIFLKLARNTYHEAKSKKYNFIIGFANSNSFSGFIKYLGFKELKPINFLKINYKNKSKHSITKTSINKYPKKIGKLWKEYKSKNKFQIKIERTDKFIDWRYKRNTSVAYYTAYKKNEYFVILKKYEDKLHIVDFMYKNAQGLEQIIEISKIQARLEGSKELTCWVPEKQDMVNLIKLQSKKLKSDSHFIVKSLNKKLEHTLNDIGNWYYTMGDSDIF